MTSDGTTRRPWARHSQHDPGSRWGDEFWWLESEDEHDIGDIGTAADAALIVEAVNAYDRLRAIEAAARAVADAKPYSDDLEFAIERLRAALGDET